jgi:hypothetical protein
VIDWLSQKQFNSTFFELWMSEKVALDVAGEMFVNFRMARNRLAFARYRMPIDIMIPPVSKQRTTSLFQFSNKLPSLHTVICFTA